MIKTQILDKRSICHALLTSTYDPEVMIPIKGIIEEVYFEENIPVYSIRIIKFYDNIHFLKSNFIGKSFLTNYKGKPKPIQIPKEIKTITEMENWLGESSKYRFCIESNLVVKTKNEMMELFNRIGEYLLLQKLRAIRKIVLRTPYDGPLKLNSTAEYSIRIERAFSDLFATSDEAKKFIENIG
jgi:hypothetical protein